MNLKLFDPSQKMGSRDVACLPSRLANPNTAVIGSEGHFPCKVIWPICPVRLLPREKAFWIQNTYIVLLRALGL